MANLGIAVAAIATITIARPWLRCSSPVRPNITHHARLATVATERELDQLAPGSVLAKKNNGVFPFDSVYEIIDGRKTIIAHGTRDVPIWGDRYTPEPSKALIPRPSKKSRRVRVSSGS